MSKKKRPRSVASLERKRSPGLDGTYNGTCVACLRATDTALGVRGVPEWHAGFLVAVGLPEQEADATVSRFLAELAAGGGYRVEAGEYDMVYRVCGRCASRVPSLPAPVLVIPGNPVPTIAQPRD